MEGFIDTNYSISTVSNLVILFKKVETSDRPAVLGGRSHLS